MLFTSLNIVDPFLQDNATGILDMMKADWRHLDRLNIESVGSVNWLSYLWIDMSDYVLLC